MATSKKTLRVELAPELKRAIRRLPKGQRQQIGQAVTAVQGGFGTPHRHSGLGIRRLRDTIFECRVGLKLRLIFSAESGVLSFTDLGTHDQIRDKIKNR